MPESSFTRLKDKIEKALGEKSKRDALYTAMKRGRDNRRLAVDLLPGGENFRKEVRATKLRCLAKQDELVDRFADKVRRFVRPYFLNADIGMTGANIGIAELGVIVIETNEGNARLVSSIPDVHICIMGREKIVETVEDALQMMLAHPISAVGQHLTTYETLMGGDRPWARVKATAAGNLT